MKSEMTSVRRAGPPPVRGRMRSNVFRVWMVMRMRFRASTGASWGRISIRRRAHGRRPSRSAASCSSRGMRCKPANCRIMLNAHPRHALAAMTEVRARPAEDRSGKGPIPTSDR